MSIMSKAENIFHKHQLKFHALQHILLRCLFDV